VWYIVLYCRVVGDIGRKIIGPQRGDKFGKRGTDAGSDDKLTEPRKLKMMVEKSGYLV